MLKQTAERLTVGSAEMLLGSPVEGEQGVRDDK